MRSALFVAALAMLVISTHAWKQPSWEDMKEAARKRMKEVENHLPALRAHLDALRKHLPSNMQITLQNTLQKMEQHDVKNDVNKAAEAMERHVMARWRNLAASQGLHVRDQRALETLMRHMSLIQARLNMQRSTMMETYAHHLASHLGGQRSADEVKAMSSALNTFGHNYMRKFMDGVQAIMYKNGVNINTEQLSQALHHSVAEAMKGKDIMEALMAEMKKMGVNTDGLDAVVKNELKTHFEKMKAEGMADLRKFMVDHNITMKTEELVAALKEKCKEMMEKMKAMQGAAPKTMMLKMKELAQQAFKNMQSGDHHKLMMKLRLIIRPALDSHVHMIARIYQKHKMGISHTLIHYTIYHRMSEQYKKGNHHHHHHHHRHHHQSWWHKKPVRLSLMIGGSILGVAVLIALIIVIVHMLKEKRRTPRRKEIFGEEKSALPYSIMDEKSSTQA